MRHLSVEKVTAQRGGADAVGAPSLNVTEVDGSFTQGKVRSSTGLGAHARARGGRTRIAPGRPPGPATRTASRTGRRVS